MRRIALTLLVATLFSLGLNAALADVPTVTDLQVETTAEGNTATATIRHSGPTGIHYVSKLEVRIGDDIEVISLEPQSSVSFTETFNVSNSEGFDVRAYCTLHGWSAWKSIASDSPEPVDEPSGGIPGFSLLAIGLGLAALLLRWER